MTGFNVLVPLYPRRFDREVTRHCRRLNVVMPRTTSRRLRLLLLVLAGCTTASDQQQVLTLATTTSTRDSGLLDALLPIFEQQTGIRVKVVAVGSGQALELGRRGDADVLLVHSPSAEQQFMAEGHGTERHNVMHNDFVLVGPQADPAAARAQSSVADAFRQIAHTESLFVSRGDESGTHAKEQSIWAAAIEPRGDWYIRAGSGMAEALRMASEKHAYTLSDRGTYLSQRDQLDLAILCQGDPLLRNPYSVIVVSSEKHAKVNRPAADQFARFLLSADARRVIETFGVEQYGQPLFFPTGSPTPGTEQTAP